MEAVARTLETEAVSPEISENEIEQDSKARRRKIGRSLNDANDNDAGANSKKTLVADYVSDVSSEDFSGPEDGECESDGGGHAAAAATTTTTAPVRHHRSVRNSLPPKSGNRRRVVLPPEPARSVNILPSLVENASPIEDDDLDNLGEFCLECLIKISTLCQESMFQSLQVCNQGKLASFNFSIPDENY